MFRRNVPIINNYTAQNILKKGALGIPKSWKVNKKEIKNIYNSGYEKITKIKNLNSVFLSKELPQTLPEFGKSKSIIDGAKKCIGVLDGTSHFIDLYKIDELINQQKCKT